MKSGGAGVALLSLKDNYSSTESAFLSSTRSLQPLDPHSPLSLYTPLATLVIASGYSQSPPLSLSSSWTAEFLLHKPGWERQKWLWAKQMSLIGTCHKLLLSHRLEITRCFIQLYRILSPANMAKHKLPYRGLMLSINNRMMWRAQGTPVYVCMLQETHTPPLQEDL